MVWKRGSRLLKVNHSKVALASFPHHLGNEANNNQQYRYTTPARGLTKAPNLSCLLGVFRFVILSQYVGRKRMLSWQVAIGVANSCETQAGDRSVSKR